MVANPTGVPEIVCPFPQLYLNLVEYLGVASTCTAIQLDDVTMQSAVSLLSGLLELRK